tara:strand:+ start:28366 stop:28653 length:288 start_codon:yes stop_codon:yes gene_type:complete
MNKLKLILPLLAFVMAIGLSFAFVSNTAEDYYATGFIQIGTAWYQVDVACEESAAYPCIAQIEGETQQYIVYADRSTETPLESGTPDVKVVDDPR